MQAIMLFFWRLCLLRESPARIPPSPSLTITATTLYCVVGMVSFAISRDNLFFTTIIGVSVLSLTIEGVALYGLLFFKNYRHRFFASLTAVFAINTLFLIALLPVNYFVNNVDHDLNKNIIETLSFLVSVWWLAIIGFILNKSAEISIFQGVVLAFVIELLVAIAIRSIFVEFS